MSHRVVLKGEILHNAISKITLLLDYKFNHVHSVVSLIFVFAKIKRDAYFILLVESSHPYYMYTSGASVGNLVHPLRITELKATPSLRRHVEKTTATTIPPEFGRGHLHIHIAPILRPMLSRLAAIKLTDSSALRPT